MNETAILKACMKEASKCGAIVFRNNTGTLIDKTGRPVKFGLCVGSSDLIGLYKGKFLAIEIKTQSGIVKPEQQNFIDAVNKAGGIGFVASSVDDIKNFLTI